MRSLIIASIMASAWAFCPIQTPALHQRASSASATNIGSRALNRSGALFASASTSGASHPAMDFVQNLIETMVSEGTAAKLVSSSGEKWTQAIFAAVGAPETANEELVSNAMTFAMSKPDNQFAILLGKAEKFTINFPSEAVDGGDGTVWLECRLRDASDDELLVTMGITIQEVNGDYKMSWLDWQDFRDKFYPGLSGREWLRAF